MRASHSSSSAGGRALSAGNDPTMPALHCAMTRSGTEMMNSGAPITGIDRRPLNKAGMDMRDNPFRSSAGLGGGLEMPAITPTRQSFQCQVLRFDAAGYRHRAWRERGHSGRNGALLA